MIKFVLKRERVSVQYADRNGFCIFCMRNSFLRLFTLQQISTVDQTAIQNFFQ